MLTNDDKPFEPGEEIEFCGERVTVVKNYGDGGIVSDGETEMKWYWVFEGTPCTRVNIKLARCPECSEIYHSRDMEMKSPVQFKKTCQKCGHVEEKIHIPEEVEQAIRNDERRRCIGIVDQYRDEIGGEADAIINAIMAGGE